MTGHGFTSAFAARLDEYVEFKCSMGFYGASRIWYLKRFDVYCAEHGRSVLDRDTVEGWVTAQLSTSGRYRSWMSYIRDFGRWLRAHGDAGACVLSDEWKAGFVPAHPHLLTRGEIEAFFAAAALLDTPSPWRWQAVAFFTLMHSCGIRTCEARALLAEHVDLPGRHIDVMWSKGNRSRRLPVSDDVADVLATCDDTSRARFGPSRQTFFASSAGRPVTAAAVGVMFNRIWDQAGLPRPTGGMRPRPYDFRHHFAYANIERWMAGGIDVTAMLPYLSAYMGHATVESTYYYIHTSPGFMNAYAHITRGSSSVLPEARIRMRHDPQTCAPDFFSFARDYLHTYMPTIRGLSPKTIEAYRISLECFLAFLSDHEHIDRAKVSFDHFGRERLKAWLAWLADDKHYATRTITLRLSAIKAFLAYAAAEDIALIALSQAARTLKATPAPRKPIEYLTEAQTRAVLSAFTGRTAKSRRNRMLLILLYDTAARVGEITALTLQDLSLTKPGHVRLTGKRNKTRIVPLTDKTIEHLRVYLAEFHPDTAKLPATRPVFYSLHHGQPTGLSIDTVSSVLTQAARTARANCPTLPGNIHCHMLRKTKAMDLYQQGIPLPIIMRLLGHENASTTAAFYAFATIDMMRAAVNAATPAIDVPAGQRLTEEKLQALYSLR